MSLIKKAPAPGIGQLVNAIKGQIDVAQGSVVSYQSAKTYAEEGYKNDSPNAGEIDTAVQNLENTLKMALNSVNGLGLESLETAHIDAAVSAGLLAAAPREFFGKKVMTEADLTAYASENMVVVPSTVSGFDKRTLSVEAFDNTANKNAQTYSIVYNAYASRQDEFGETLFPTIVQTHDQVGFTVSVQLIEVIADIKHAISGSVTDWQRKNVIKALKDSTILENTSTALVPVNRTESASLFNTDIGTFTQKVGTEEVTTGALIPGKRFSLLGVSQTAAQVAAGLADSTDAVDSAVKLNRVYVKLAGSDDIIRFDTGNLPTFTWNQTIQGNSRTLQLAAETKSLSVSSATNQIDNTPLTAAAVIGTNKVRLSLNMYGTINQQEGSTIVNAGTIAVEKVFDSAGVELGLSAGTGATIKALFDGATIVGYTLDARRTNSNRRQRGQLIDTRELNYLYAVPVLEPISALRSHGAGDAQDQFLLGSLITATRIRTSNSAVKTLLEAVQQLKQVTTAISSGTDSVQVFGAASELVTPTYVEDTIDVTKVDSLTSADRAVDVTALIINKIRDAAYRLYRDSNYKSADDALSGGAASKPLVIIATDQVIGRYLTESGDNRLLGEYFQYKVVTSVDDRMKGKLIVTLGKQEALGSGVPNPLHFGNMAWKPELTLVLPNVRGGSSVMELTVQPMFLHVPNLPVIANFTVTGIEDVIADKVAIDFNNV